MARISLLTAILLGTVSQAVAQGGCPICCLPPSLTLTERLSQSSDAILVSWERTQPSTEGKNGQTVFRVSKVVKSKKKSIRAGDLLTLPRDYSGKKGKQFLLFGNWCVPTGKRIPILSWDSPLAVTNLSFNYIVKAPSPKSSKHKRLAYFLEHLEHADVSIASDAYTELSSTTYENLYALRKIIPREKVSQWVSSSKTSETRLGFYGLLLGLSGNEDDALILEKMIRVQPKDFRLSIDGVMAGYLLLKGEEGLEVLIETKLKNKQAAFSETYAVMQAIRFLWTYEPRKIPKERLKQAMRILLDRDELLDLVISDLGRWEDWSILDLVMTTYYSNHEKEEFYISSMNQAVIKYMLACSHSHDHKFGDPPEYIHKVRANLAILHWENPKLFQDIEQYLYEKN